MIVRRNQMPKMKRDRITLAFKKAWHKDGCDGWYAFFIWIRTLASFCHVELRFSNGDSWSAVDGEGGVRFKKIAYTHDYRWEFVDIPLSKLPKQYKTEQDVYDYCKTIKGEYDWMGIFLWEGLPLGIEDKTKWYCSEVVAYALGLKKYRINPGELYKKAKMLLK